MPETIVYFFSVYLTMKNALTISNVITGKCISGVWKVLVKENCIDIRDYSDNFTFVVEEFNNEINCCKI